MKREEFRKDENGETKKRREKVRKMKRDKKRREDEGEGK